MAGAPAGSRLPDVADIALGGGQMVGIMFLYGVWAAIAVLSVVAVAMMLKEQ